MLFERLVALLALILGFLGAVAFLVGSISSGSRAPVSTGRTTRSSPYSRPQSGRARRRDSTVRQPVQESKLTNEEMGKLLRDWAARTSRRTGRVAARNRGQGGPAGPIASASGAASLETARQVPSEARAEYRRSSVGTAGTPPPEGRRLLEKLTSLRRGALQQAEETVEGVREFVAKVDDLASSERTSRAGRLVARFMLPIVDVDSRLRGKAADGSAWPSYRSRGQLEETVATSTSWRRRRSWVSCSAPGWPPGRPPCAGSGGTAGAGENAIPGEVKGPGVPPQPSAVATQPGRGAARPRPRGRGLVPVHGPRWGAKFR